MSAVADSNTGTATSDAFIAPSGTDVTDAFRMYLRPLLGSGMPDAYRLRGAAVPKIGR